MGDPWVPNQNDFKLNRNNIFKTIFKNDTGTIFLGGMLVFQKLQILTHLDILLLKNI